MATDPYRIQLDRRQYPIASPSRPDPRDHRRISPVAAVIAQIRRSCSSTSLQDRVRRPDWVRDQATYEAWRKSLAQPCKVFILPTPFKCGECGCEKLKHLPSLGIAECAWCSGRGRQLKR